MPLGLDTPSTFGSVFLILGPAFLGGQGRGLDADAAARHAWFVGIAMILASGVFKLGLRRRSAGWIRRVVPRAGLLGSLTAIALVIISFLPLIDIAAQPIAGIRRAGGDPGDADGPLGAARRRSRGPWRRWSSAASIYYGMHLAGLGPGLGGGEVDRPSLALRAVLPMPVGRVARAGSGRSGARRSATCRWRSRWPWRRSSAGSTAPRAPRRPATTTRPARSSPPRGSPRSSAASSAG